MLRPEPEHPRAGSELNPKGLRKRQWKRLYRLVCKPALLNPRVRTQQELQPSLAHPNSTVEPLINRIRDQGNSATARPFTLDLAGMAEEVLSLSCAMRKRSIRPKPLSKAFLPAYTR